MQAGQEITLPDQDDLRDAIIEGIETFTAADIVATPQGLPVISDLLSRGILLTFAEKSNDRVKFLPYHPARAVLLSGQVRQFVGWSITWPQSRARCVAPLNNDEQIYLMIGVHFRYATDTEV
jgi:hypothetical protein